MHKTPNALRASCSRGKSLRYSRGVTIYASCKGYPVGADQKITNTRRPPATLKLIGE